MSEFLEPYPEDPEENQKLNHYNLDKAVSKRGREAILSYRSYVCEQYAGECVEQGFMEPFDVMQNGSNFIPADHKTLIEEMTANKGLKASHDEDLWTYEKYDDEGSEFLGIEVYSMTEKMRTHPKEVKNIDETLHERLKFNDVISNMAKTEMLDALVMVEQALEGEETLIHPGEMTIEERDEWTRDNPDAYIISLSAFDETGKRKSGMCDFYAVVED